MHDDHCCNSQRRSFLKTFAGVAAASAVTVAGASTAQAATMDAYADPANPALEKGNMKLDPSRAALVVIDPQIDFMSPAGRAWPVVGESVTEHNVVPNLSRLFQAAKAAGIVVAISPHHYYPWDHDWKIQGPLEIFQHQVGIFDRKGPYTLDGFRGSGADFLPEFKQYIEDGKTIICSPHKLYGPQQNWWRQGMMGGAKAHYDGIEAFSETDFTEDLNTIEVPTLVMHGDDDQIVPIADSAPLSAKLLKNSTLKIYKNLPHGMCTTHADVVNPDLLAFVKA